MFKECLKSIIAKMVFFDAWANTCFYSRIGDVIKAQKNLEEAFARYRERVKETLAEEAGLPIEEFYELLGVDATQYKIKSVTGI